MVLPVVCRYAGGAFYTRIGDILVACNPFRKASLDTP